MRAIVQLLRQEARARRFFAAHAQSALGTGVGFVALVLLAYQRMRSPWAIALVLLADFLPPMLLGPVLGAAADRWSRRWCAVAGDAARAVAFAGMGLVGGFPATFAFALLAGLGTGIYKPAVMSGMPALFGRERLPQANSLYGTLTELGYTLGPALAAPLMLALEPGALLVANGATFAVSAMVLAGMPLDGRSAGAFERAQPASILRDAREGVALVRARPRLATVILGTGAVILFGGMMNVAELLLVRQLGAGRSGYSALVAASGIGIALGALAASRGGEPRTLEKRFSGGLALFAAALVAAGATPVFAGALVAIAVAGVGNGLVITYERLVIQNATEERLLGRVFGVQNAVDSAAFAAAFVSAGAILTAISPRTLFVVAGVGGAAVWLATRVALASARARAPEPEPAAVQVAAPERLPAGRRG